ncbi:prenyltransferase/squalene oxidase repeat-containing protein [Bacillus infantis]|uniref:Prenyltransferase alpha-alpha toroid domain-containing protein n=1 Tax=Bacillus infantis TaxID=324767 RepID=A0A5D4QRX6_9BACI|nr:hypothetical protein [Bacillus infantis]TYS40764.1 hypothetical protein FZD51_24750 [Bacillus infantis]
MDYGGYSIEPAEHQYGNLYSSYFILNTMDLLGEKLDASEEASLENFILEQIHLIDNKKNPNVVYDLYYAAEILRISNYEDSEIMKIIYDKLMKFQLKDGSFVSSYEELERKVPNENNIRSTVMAISIIKANDKRISKDTTDWLLTQWNAIDKTEINTAKLTQILKGLSLIGNKDITSIIGIDLDLFKSFYLSVLDGDSEDGTLLYDLQDVIILDEIFNFNSKPNPNLVERIYKEQNMDGGWNIFLDDYSEEQGTEAALSFLSHYNIEIPNEDLLSKTVNEQKSFNGGFSPIVQKEFSLKNSSYIYMLSQKLGLKYHNKEKTKSIIQDIMNSDYNLFNSEDLLQLNALATEFEINNSKLIDYAEIKLRDENKLQSVENIYDLLNFYKITNGKNSLAEYNIDPEVLDKDNYFTELLLLNLNSIDGIVSKEHINNYWEKYKDSFVKDSDKNSSLVFMLLSSLPIDKDDNNDVYKTLIHLLNKRMHKYSATMEPLSIQDFYYTLESIENLNRME